MEASKKESVVLTVKNFLISSGLSALGSFVNFPLGVIAGLAVPFICIAILGTVTETILALQGFKHVWLLVVGFSVTAVPALIAYSYLLGLGGLSPYQISLAAFCFFYIFLVFSFIFTCLEILISSRRQNLKIS